MTVLKIAFLIVYFVVVCLALTLYVFRRINFAFGKCKHSFLRTIKWTNVLLVGVPLLLVMSYFIWPEGDVGESDNAVYVFVSAVYNTLGVFLVNNPWEFSCQSFSFAFFGNTIVVGRSILQLLIGILYVVAPLMTLGAISLIFHDPITIFRYHIQPWRRAHVFSTLNERSMELAKSILSKKRGYPKPIILFCNTNSEDNSCPSNQLNEVQCMGALFTKKKIGEFNITKKSHVYFIGSNQEKNVTDAIRISSIENHEKSYAFSCNESAEVLINTYNNSCVWKEEDNENSLRRDRNNHNKVPITLISESRIIAHDLLFRYPLFAAKRQNDSQTPFTMLIFGCGQIGMEIAKLAASCCQRSADNIQYLRLILADVRGDLKERFERGNFGLVDELRTNYGVSVEFVSEVDARDQDESKIGVVADTVSVDLLFDMYPGADYIVVALGDDELTINTSVQARRYYERVRINESTTESKEYSQSASINQPIIISIVRNDENSEAIYNSCISDSQVNAETPKYNLIPFGRNSYIYDYDIICDWYLERVAKWSNWIYDFRIDNSTDDKADNKKNDEIGNNDKKTKMSDTAKSQTSKKQKSASSASTDTSNADNSAASLPVDNDYDLYLVNNMLKRFEQYDRFEKRFGTTLAEKWGTVLAKRYIRLKHIECDKKYLRLPEIEKESNLGVALHTIYKLYDMERINSRRCKVFATDATATGANAGQSESRKVAVNEAKLLSSFDLSELKCIKSEKDNTIVINNICDYLNLHVEALKKYPDLASYTDALVWAEQKRWNILYLMRGYEKRDSVLSNEEKKRMFPRRANGKTESKNYVTRVHSCLLLNVDGEPYTGGNEFNSRSAIATVEFILIGIGKKIALKYTLVDRIAEAIAVPIARRAYSRIVNDQAETKKNHSANSIDKEEQFFKTIK